MTVFQLYFITRQGQFGCGPKFADLCSSLRDTQTLYLWPNPPCNNNSNVYPIQDKWELCWEYALFPAYCILLLHLVIRQSVIDERWLFQRMGIGTYPWGSHELAREKETKWILELWTESPHLVDFISSNHVGPHCRMMCGCWRLCQRLEPLRLSCNCACCIELSQILYKAM